MTGILLSLICTDGGTQPRAKWQAMPPSATETRGQAAGAG